MSATENLKERINALNNWLFENISHPDFEEKHRELNNLVYKLEMLETKPANRKKKIAVVVTYRNPILN